MEPQGMYDNKERLHEKIKELTPIDYRRQALSNFFYHCLFSRN